MQSRTISAAVLTLACLLLGGCREHNEPVKPIAAVPAYWIAAAAALS